MHDKELIDKILLNDQSAFELLIRKYQKLVFNSCYRILKNRSDAEDISQDVFMEVFRSLSSLKSIDDMSGWIYRIAYCKCISLLRKNNPADPSRNCDPDRSVKDLDKDPKHHNRETPDKTMETEEARIELFRNIDLLPDNQKRAILLHKFEGYSHKEICDEMGLTQASVESLIYRAKVSLRKSLASFFENY